MKVKVSKLLVSLTAVLLLTLTAYAQDELPLLESQDPAHREFNLDEDKILIYDNPSHLSVVKDSTQQAPRVVPGHPVKTSKPDTHKNVHKEKEEEDALSFNFLYYMIQKFKMSDLIDN
jgi:hypothetical protein